MAQQGEINQNSLVQGLFTEASAINYPAGGTLVDQNFVLDSDGTRKRRLGLGLETGAVLGTNNPINGDLFVFNWDAVGDDGDVNLAVIATNNEIRFYDKSVDPLSDGEIDPGLTFARFGHALDAAVIDGKLIVVGANGEVSVYTYDAGTITWFSENLLVRDIWGVDETQAVDFRPATLTDKHAYNLANQGWFESWASAVQVEVGNWPSDADVAIYGLSPNSDSSEIIHKERYYRNVPFGSTPAPKGAAIIRLTSTGSSRVGHAFSKGFGSLSLSDLHDFSFSQPNTVASYAGRVFYAGFTNNVTVENDTYPNLSGLIAFSQTVTNNGHIHKCYAAADPTSEDSEVVATDGGTISIPGTGLIHKLVPMGRSLLVFAAEGVWEIFSTDELFSATNFQVKQLTDVGSHSPKSVIIAGNTPLYWTDFGIYALRPEQVSESFIVENITENTIQTFFNRIERHNIRKAVGFYDKFEQKAHWLFYSGPEDILDTFDTELILDMRLQSWYTNVYPSATGLRIAGMVDLNNYSELSTGLAGRTHRSFKYVVKDENDTRIKFYEHNDPSFEDFGSTDAAAVMITGPYTGGDSTRRKSGSYITLNFNKTETGFELDGSDLVPVNTSSCILETRWDWTDLSKAGKFNSPIEAYRHRRHYIPVDVNDEFEDGNTVVTTKSRIRGSGRALAIKISSSPEKDLSILGWNVQLTQNEKV